jgi:hypothetical protein
MKVKVKTGSVAYSVEGVKHVAQAGEVLDLPSELVAKIDHRFIEAIQTSPPAVEEATLTENPLPNPPKKRTRKQQGEISCGARES